MFKKPTVFILGAGASWHYGYPTGEYLVGRVESMARKLEAFFKGGKEAHSGNVPLFAARNSTGNVHTDWGNAEVEAKELAKRLKEVNPTLIDYFLAQNAEVHDIGRLAIALVILECEHSHFGISGNHNHAYLRQVDVRRGKIAPGGSLDVTAFQDDWLRFIIYNLTTGCPTSSDLLTNNVKFITFNYDASLEQRLLSGLSNISHFKPEDVESFLSNDRVYHVYGALREQVKIGWTPLKVHLPGQANVEGFLEAVDVLDVAFKASQGIRTIDGDGKTKNNDVIEKAKDVIDKAEVIYILGFGFDSQNIDRLKLSNLRPTKGPARSVYVTNYNGHNRVSIAAGKALMNGPNAFLNRSEPIQTIYWTTDGDQRLFRYEMSIKNVYDALAEDFESLEAI